MRNPLILLLTLLTLFLSCDNKEEVLKQKECILVAYLQPHFLLPGNTNMQGSSNLINYSRFKEYDIHYSNGVPFEKVLNLKKDSIIKSNRQIKDSLIYDNLGRVSEMQRIGVVFDDDNNINSREVIHRIIYFYKKDSDLQPFILKRIADNKLLSLDSITYNKNSIVIRNNRYYSNSSEDSSQEIYSYDENENIGSYIRTSIFKREFNNDILIDTIKEVKKYKYDTYKNPLYKLPVVEELELRLSKNNIIGFSKKKYRNSEQIFYETFNFSRKYNEKGYPVEGYTYNCGE